MGRPREFDEAQALENAMDAFWSKGFEATSLADLCECTGLHKGSLYQAFGDKHQLFMRALKHYSESQFDSVASVIREDATPLQNLKAVATKICTDHMQCQGCMMVNTMVELAPHDEEVRAYIEAERERREQVMCEMVSAAQAAGEIRSDREPARLARQLMVTMAGVAATVKAFLEPDDGLQTVHDVIESWT